MPSCLPPPISDYNSEDYEEGSRKRKIKFGDDVGGREEEQGRELEGGGKAAAPGAPNSLQKKMLAMAGQDLDVFMKEMEVMAYLMINLMSVLSTCCDPSGGAQDQGGREGCRAVPASCKAGWRRQFKGSRWVH